MGALVACGESGTQSERALGLLEDTHAETQERKNPTIRTVSSNFVPKECEVLQLLQ